MIFFLGRARLESHQSRSLDESLMPPMHRLPRVHWWRMYARYREVPNVFVPFPVSEEGVHQDHGWNRHRAFHVSVDFFYGKEVRAPGANITVLNAVPLVKLRTGAEPAYHHLHLLLVLLASTLGLCFFAGRAGLRALFFSRASYARMSPSSWW